MKNVLLLLILLTLSIVGDEAKCLGYNPEKFIVIDDKGEELKPIEWVYLMALGEIEEQKDIALVTKAAGRIYRHDYINCKRKEYGFACGGECDSGQLILDQNMRLQLSRISFINESESEGIQSDGEIKPKDNKAWLKANVESCPEYVFEGSYVCYDKRKGKEYKECIRSQNSCKSMGKKHFGYYADEQATRDAFGRCQSSEPKFVD